MIIFDHSLGVLDPSIEDEILLYHLISCMYIIYKVEARFSLFTFEQFLYQNVSKKSYDALQSHLAPHLQTLVWTPDIFPMMENQILQKALRFKINLVSPAEVIYTFSCSFMNQVSNHEVQNKTCFIKCIQEALYRSYICLQGKLYLLPSLIRNSQKLRQIFLTTSLLMRLL